MCVTVLGATARRPRNVRVPLQSIGLPLLPYVCLDGAIGPSSGPRPLAEFDNDGEVILCLTGVFIGEPEGRVHSATEGLDKNHRWCHRWPQLLSDERSNQSRRHAVAPH